MNTNQITLYDYVAHQNPKGANELLEQYGYAPINSIQLISQRLKEIVKIGKEKALAQIALIHPDNALIQSSKEKYDETVNMPRTFIGQAAESTASTTSEIINEIKSAITPQNKNESVASNQNMWLFLGVALIVVIAIKN
jgi:uncharacterized UBP type Zn finger protein